MKYDSKKIISIVIITGALISGMFIGYGIFFPAPFSNPLLNNDQGENSVGSTEILGVNGEIIAKRMNTTYTQIEYLWLFNNTFVNEEISSEFNSHIDAVRVSKINDTLQIAIIQEPKAIFAPIENQAISTALEGFTNIIYKLNKTVDASFTSLFPPKFMVDIAYQRGVSLSLVYCPEKQLLGIINGTWKLSEYSHLGVNIIEVNYTSMEMVFFQLMDSDIIAIIDSIAMFKNLILATFIK